METITAETGTKVTFMEVAQQDTVNAMTGKVGAKAAEELAENMVLVRDYKYFGLDSEAETAKSQAILPEAPTSWAQFVKAHWH